MVVIIGGDAAGMSAASKILRLQPETGITVFDVAAATLHADFSLDDLLFLDLSYAPPFAGVWDPIVIAACMALKEG